MTTIENQTTYVCPSCARVLVVYIQLPDAPMCMRCNKAMEPASTDTVPGQLTLFKNQKRQRQ